MTKAKHTSTVDRDDFVPQHWDEKRRYASQKQKDAVSEDIQRMMLAELVGIRMLLSEQNRTPPPADPVPPRENNLQDAYPWAFEDEPEPEPSAVERFKAWFRYWFM